jgi:hypothetical protein
MVFGAFNMFQTDSGYGNSVLSNKAIVTTNPNVTPTPYLEPINSKLYWVYSFTNTSAPYTMSFSNVSEIVPLSILAVGGGGSGGLGGGGGAGGFVEQNKSLTGIETFTITVGNVRDYSPGTNTTLTNSTDFQITALGGGGANFNGYSLAGGSGAGGNRQQYTGGQGTQSTSSSGGYGNNGGNLIEGAEDIYAGGGGGAGTVGDDGSEFGGNGGDGRMPTLLGLNKIYYAGGGASFNGQGGLGQSNKGGGGNNNSISGEPGIVIIAIPQEYVSN